jgi:pimeloyl-ACP methyl ester carboxylesterase
MVKGSVRQESSPVVQTPSADRKRQSVARAAVLLLCFFPAGGLKAVEGDEPSAPSGGAKPDPFRSEELAIPAGDHQLAGTLYLPLSRTPAPAVVFVHGAGPSVRGDGYHELGRHFARKGVAALIYDKRGCGASTGDWTRAGLYDLAEDALACVRLLRGRPDIKPASVGLWGLSQGASIIPIAAGRSPDVAFLIAVGGCLDFDEQMRYFRANLFRQLGHAPAVLDIANKAFLIQVDLSNRIRSGSLPAPRTLQDACRMEFDLDQAAVWRQVHQPVLAIYGERDRQVPAAESSAALAAALAQSGNKDLTLIIYPGASHAIGKTRTGELGAEWLGYVPEYLDDMSDWVLQQASGVKRPEGWPQRARAAKSDQPFAAGHYDRLRWYGNAPVQAIQFIVFVLVFVGTGVAGTVRLFRRGHCDEIQTVTRSRKWLTWVAIGLSLVNLLLLTGLVTLTRALAVAWQPTYPSFLNWLPVAGLLSACLTLTLVALIFGHWRTLAKSRRKRIGWLVLASCALAFLPYLHYWNVLGLAWSA